MLGYKLQKICIQLFYPLLGLYCLYTPQGFEWKVKYLLNKNEILTDTVKFSDLKIVVESKSYFEDEFYFPQEKQVNVSFLRLVNTWP